MSYLLALYRKAFGAFMAGTAAVQVYCVVTTEQQYRASLKWKSAKARIISLHVFPTDPSKDRIEYEFFHEGATFRGDRLYSTDIWLVNHPARKQLSQDAEICIRYDPANPSKSAVFTYVDRLAQLLLAGNAVASSAVAWKLVRNLPLFPRAVV
ncbi:hypothetical protein XU18_0859 [Perkinsela sp. CCAP 1560/4]|nr:hypothetical protein XU18_0859 [Perkinsela sp. CCAP 1560/4]|eukprot:KNH08662.1 hypothetical protein XU18_0859 [Perkinsela sp. CCAP 1560/4]